MGRIIAFDYGTERIGVAVSDGSNTIAMALPYIPSAQKKSILALIKEKKVTKILLGLPLGMSGAETKMTVEVKKFAEWLEKMANVSVEFIDERLSSKGAAGQMAEIGMNAKEQRRLIDSMVAYNFLESYLKDN